MSNDSGVSRSSVPDGYISFVARIWVGDNGKLIRGTIEDAHTGTRLALDLSALGAFLYASLTHAPPRAGDSQNGEEEDVIEERLGEIPGEGSSDTDSQDSHVQDP